MNDQTASFPTTKKAMLRDFHAGSCVAWAELMESYRRPIESLVTRIMKRYTALGHCHPNEVTSDFFTFLREGNRVGKYSSREGKFRAWLRTVARNFVISLDREERRQQGRTAPIVADTPVYDARELEELEEREWASALLQRSLERLESDDPKQGTELRQLLERHYGIGRDAESIDDTSKALGFSEKSFYNRKYKAIARLKSAVLVEVRQIVNDTASFEQELHELIHRLVDTIPDWNRVS